MFTFVICVQNSIAKEEDPAKEALKAKGQADIDTERAKVQKMLEQRRKTRRIQQPLAPKDKMNMDRRRLKMMDQQIDRRKQEYADFVGELKAAKELALTENATKTAKKLEEIIKKQEKHFAETTGDYQQTRDQIRKQFQEENLPAELEASDEGTAEEPKEKKARWWKFWN